MHIRKFRKNPADDWPPPNHAHMAVFGAGALWVLHHMWKSNGASWLFHPVNLAIHEAGHAVFAPFGQFLDILGGSIFQCLIPFVCVFYFIRRNQPMGAAAAGMWFGENFLDVAVYIADARDMALPLVGGVIHDWNWLLSRAGLLSRCASIAYTVSMAGWGIMLFSAGWYTWLWAEHAELHKSLPRRRKSDPHHFFRK